MAPEMPRILEDSNVLYDETVPSARPPITPCHGVKANMGAKMGVIAAEWAPPSGRPHCSKP